MTRSTILTIAILTCLGLSLAYAQQKSDSVPENSAIVADEYRVMHLSEMFEGDEVAKKKIAQLSVTVKGGNANVSFTRTDMDTDDYERALNRWAKEGWTLVTVNKSNYWVFKRPRPTSDQQ